MEIKKISFNKFKNECYKYYLELFPDNERKTLTQIEKMYKLGIEYLYEIINTDKVVGFFTLQKIDDNYPYYLDYFGIFKEYQDNGYGTEAIKELLDSVIKDDFLVGEIESTDFYETEEDKIIRKRRAKFWENLGLKPVNSKYSLWKVVYTPYYYSKSKELSKKEIDEIMFKYYLINSDEEKLNKNCYIIY